MDIGSLVNKPTVTAPSGGSSNKAQENQDRFLTLLVAQMKNQDPMSPMENAQLTTQIAQIQTVTGVENLNTNIEKLVQQSQQAQAFQGVAMVGRDVTLEGSRLAIKPAGAEGSFELAGPADQVRVHVTTAAGTVIDTIDLGAASGGKHSFEWNRAGLNPNAELHFKVEAQRGSQPVNATTFTRDTVVSVNTQGGKLGFQLASGLNVSADAILSVD
jgi:flagellar basal-body rod modification protein FlgD